MCSWKKYLLFTLCAVALLPATIDDARLSAGSRCEALGFAVVADQAGEVYVNPAAIINHKALQVQYSSGQVFEDYHKYSLGISSHPVSSNIALGFNLTGAEISDIPRVELNNERPEILGYEQNRRSIAILTAALALWPGCSVGCNTKVYRQQLFTETAAGMSCDLGALWQLQDNISLGITRRNINGGALRWSSGTSEAFAEEWQTGVSWRGQILFCPMVFNVDQIRTEQSSEAYQCYGAELNIVPQLAFRLGKQPEQSSFGLGLTLDKAQLDYAYLLHEDLGTSHKFSLGLTL